ncbi:MAG: hypothetical protein A2270_10535 [Elusimicrobia bacterium RIFOXYA12_FULL_51_18]|nr:MAG: hypothetical protein A2270_10535 [Elusimicrobia bacterium RIFOXYA12_FULL_51_18]OGS29499.1 MAG: hypothetical protein A2218_00655 [Elusimicrobia bacterium RIFOXYA2_FULL_53_38]
MAETFTEKLKLSKRDTGDLNWGQGANANLEAVDAHSQQATLRPPRTLAATLGSGAVGANLVGNTNYFYKIVAVNASGETTEGKIPAIVEAQVTQPAIPLPVILQWETVKGATGYKIYKTTTSGQEKFLASVSGESTSTYTDDGNTAPNPAISVPAANTATLSVSKVTAGSGILVTPSHGTGEVLISAAGGSGVSSLRRLSEAAGLTGDVKLEAGSNITMTQDAVNNKISIAAAAGGAWAKIAEVNLSEWWSTSGTIAVPAGDADLFKLLLEVNQADGGALTLNMFVNGRLTLTDYYSQKLLVDGASITADRTNSPRIAEFLAGQIGFVEMIFGPTHDTVSGNVRFSVLQPQGSPLGVSIPKIILYQWLHTLQMAQYPVNDLESIVIKPAGGQAAGWSRLRLYKLV